MARAVNWVTTKEPGVRLPVDAERDDRHVHLPGLHITALAEAHTSAGSFGALVLVGRGARVHSVRGEINACRRAR